MTHLVVSKFNNDPQLKIHQHLFGWKLQQDQVYSRQIGDEWTVDNTTTRLMFHTNNGRGNPQTKARNPTAWDMR